MKTTRREFSKSAGLLALAPWACSQPEPEFEGVLVNDIHSQLTSTRVSEVVPAPPGRDEPSRSPVAAMRWARRRSAPTR